MTLAIGKSPPRSLTSLEMQRYAAFRNNCIKKLIFVLLIISAIILVVPAFAETRDESFTLGSTTWKKSDLSGTKTQGFRWLVFSMAYYVYGALPQIVENGGALTLDPNAEYMDVFNTIYESMAAVGMGLAVMWVMLDLIEKAQMDQMTPEVLIRWCIKLVVAIIVVDNGADLAKALMQVGNDFVNQLSVASAENGPSVEILNDFFDRIKTSFWTGTLTIFLELIVPGIAMIFCLLMMFVQVFGRIIEAGVRFAFIPIGISDAFTHGINSPGMRYIKKFFAVCLQGAVLLAIMIAGTNMMALITAGDDGFGIAGNLGVVSQLVIGFTMIGAMMKSQQLVNDIVGA